MARVSLGLGLLVVAGLAPLAKADTMQLYNWGFNADGTIIDKANTTGALPNVGPAAFVTSGFNFSEGLGTLTVYVGTLLTAGTHYFDIYFDHDLRPALFGSDYSAAVGSVASGESWEIGAGSAGGGSMLWPDFQTNNYGDVDNAPGPDDVSTGLAFAFTTTSAAPLGIITINVSTTAPTSGFYLHQWNTYSGSTPSDIYISASEVNGVPEPAAWWLFGVPVAAFLWQMRKRVRVNGAGVAMLLGALALIGLPHTASAVPIVKTVPWVASQPVLPHTTWSGKVITLKGTTDQTAGTYTWNFGDGNSSSAVAITSANNYLLEATHAYSGSSGTVYTATLTVTNGTSASASYYVEIQTETLGIQANVAIDEGLWYLHKTMTRNTCGSNAVNCGHWTSGNAGSPTLYGGNQAQNTNAFEVSGHLQTGPASDPYTETVTRGFNEALSLLGTAQVTSSITNPYGTFSACNGTSSPYTSGCTGIFDNDGQGEPIYQSGMFMDMIVSSGTPTATAATGVSGVIGVTFQNIVQDMADYYYSCQIRSTSGSAYGGAWRYVCNDTTGSDGSPSQWAAIGILAAVRNWSITIPAPVTKYNEWWLAQDQSTGTSNGEFGYMPSSLYPWGPYAVTPSGLVQLTMDGLGRGQTNPINSVLSWDQAENYLRANFNNAASGGATAAIKGYYYGMFSFTKSMHLHAPGGVPTPITLLQGLYLNQTTYPPIDWYGDTTNGIAVQLTGDQLAVTLGQAPASTTGGSWYGHDYESPQYYFDTAEAIVMLNATVVNLTPVAVAKGTPNPQLPNQNVTLDGSQSYDQQPGASIVTWQWDFTGGTNFTASGVSVTNSWPAPGSYNVRLRVTDNQSPTPQTSDNVITITIEPPVAPPTADPAGPYSFCPEVTPWTLNGSGSVDPQAGQSTTGTPSAIISYGWAINGDNNFSDATGATPNVYTQLQTYVPGTAGSGNTINVTLKVTDNDLAAYNIPNESSTSTTQITVHNANDLVCSPCSITVNGRAKPEIGSKPGEVSLWWSPVSGATFYDVFRGTTSGGPYTYIGLTTATVGPYVTYLDTTAAVGTYYYTVQPYNASGSMCTSNQVTAVIVQQNERTH